MTLRPVVDRILGRWQLLAASLLVPLLGITFIGVGGRDDAYITMGAAQQLVQSGSILNYNGDRIEQSSSLLHVLILAFASWTTHLPLTWLAWGIGILAGMATVVVVGVLADRIVAGTALTASVLTAVTTPFLYWSVGSLETPIVALLIVSFALALLALLTADAESTLRSIVAPGLAIILLVMARPEGGVVVLLALAIALVLLHRMHRHDRPLQQRTDRRLLLLGGIDLVASAALATFRLLHFGRPVPQPAWAKASVSLDRAGEGFSYLIHSIDISVAVLLVLAVIGLWSLRTRWSIGSVILGSLLISSSLFIVISGGDWMGFGRFIVPVLPLIAVLAAIGFRSIGHRVILVLVVIALMGLAGVRGLTGGSMGTPIWTHPSWADPGVELVEGPWIESQNQIHYRDAAAVPPLARVITSLAATQSDQVRVGSQQAGSVVYTTRFTEKARFRFIDTLSLSTDDFTRCTSGGTHLSIGYRVDLAPWFEGRDVCGVPPPEVLLLVDCAPAERSNSAYTLIWRSGGKFEAGLLHGQGPTRQCIAVRDDRIVDLPSDLQPGRD